MGGPPPYKTGFTLIELSIVLVIIGLIVGGVLVGQDLIRAAEVRAQITQIEKYNTAVNTFYGKYGALPGDMNAATASAFGFTPRGQYAGEGDGNGVIEGVAANAPDSNFFSSSTGESVMFWVDLTTANGLNVNLIDGSFSAASPTTPPANITPTTSPTLDAYLPSAKLGRGNYIYVYSWDDTNFYGLSNVSVLGDGIHSTPSMTVQQAYSIDKKIDDGFPQTGNVTAEFISIYGIGLLWANGPSDSSGIDASTGPFTTAKAGSSTTCFDNGNNAGVAQTYSVSQNGGSGTNCALSFRLQ